MHLLLERIGRSLKGKFFVKLHHMHAERVASCLGL